MSSAPEPLVKPLVTVIPASVTLTCTPDIVRLVSKVTVTLEPALIVALDGEALSVKAGGKVTVVCTAALAEPPA